MSCSYGFLTAHRNCPGRRNENSPDWGALPCDWASVRCWLNWPVAAGTSAMKVRNCAEASAAHAIKGLAARHTAATICLIFIGGIPRWNQDFTIAIGLHGGDEPGLLHLLEQASRAVIAYAQITLHGRNGGAPVFQNDFDGLVIQGVGFSIGEAGDASDAIAGFALQGAFQQALDVVGLALLFQG